MRYHLTSILLSVLLSVSTASAEAPDELVTAPGAILCLSQHDLDIANQPAVASSRIVLRAMGCLRSESGIRTRLMDKSDAPATALRVRFYPAGISGGIVLWALPSAFTARHGTGLSRAEGT